MTCSVLHTARRHFHGAALVVINDIEKNLQVIVRKSFWSDSKCCSHCLRLDTAAALSRSKCLCMLAGCSSLHLLQLLGIQSTGPSKKQVLDRILECQDSRLFPARRLSESAAAKTLSQDISRWACSSRSTSHSLKPLEALVKHFSFWLKPSGLGRDDDPPSSRQDLLVAGLPPNDG